MTIACSVNQETSFSDFDRAAANNNGLAVGAAATMKAKGEASRWKLTRVVMSASSAVKCRGEWGSLVSLGLTRKVRLSEEISVFVINKSSPSPHPFGIQIWPERIRLCAGPPACAATAQATWHNNGQRKGRSSDKMNRSETREVR